LNAAAAKPLPVRAGDTVTAHALDADDVAPIASDEVRAAAAASANAVVELRAMHLLHRRDATGSATPYWIGAYPESTRVWRNW
jgi:hypothetical protein